MKRAVFIATLLLTPLPWSPGKAAIPDASVGNSENGSVRFVLTGHVVAADGKPIAKAHVRMETATATTDAQGGFLLPVLPGEDKISISATGYAPLAVPVSISANTDLNFELQLSTTTTVSAQVDSPTSAALTQTFSSDELLQAFPGQPGVPVVVPGYPSETASGGVKAPQYFAPGVVGDHGEPIAQYIRIGDFLFPNNLPANAHGNGYADPNLLIPNAIGFVEVDAGAFDVRHGNNAVDLAVAYGLVPRLESFIQIPLTRAIMILFPDGVRAIRRRAHGWAWKSQVAMDFSGCPSTAINTRSTPNAHTSSGDTC
jgi:hypothetical protein